MEKNLVVNGISACYGKKIVLKNVSVCVPAGELTCLCGPNGCGKSTLLSVLAGVPDERLSVLKGTTTYFSSHDIDALTLQKLPRKKSAQIVSFMQQNEYSTWDFSVRELVLQGRFCHTKNGFYTNEDERLADKALEELQLTALADRTVHSLSGGEFQKARIARAICQQAAFILLDEPAANLDFVYEPWLMKKLHSLAHENNIGILISVHDVNLAASYADNLILLPLLGAPVCGKIGDTLNKDNLKLTYGMEFECQKVNYFQSSL
ncbi:MAG: ABC transporter ATP-binding protein [Treponema sp.]|nr:ABC transporter ATP-binding protein [Treponema sp.]